MAGRQFGLNLEQPFQLSFNSWLRVRTVTTLSLLLKRLAISLPRGRR